MVEKFLEIARVQDLETKPVHLLPKREQDLESEKLQNGLAKLVLTLVRTITEVLERQAARRVESGALNNEEVERLGLAFMQIREKTTQIADKFGLETKDLALEVSDPATQGQVTLVDVVDRLIDEGTVISGDVRLSVAGIDLATLRLIATLSTK